MKYRHNANQQLNVESHTVAIISEDTKIVNIRTAGTWKHQDLRLKDSGYLNFAHKDKNTMYTGIRNSEQLNFLSLNSAQLNSEHLDNEIWSLSTWTTMNTQTRATRDVNILTMVTKVHIMRTAGLKAVRTRSMCRRTVEWEQGLCTEELWRT